MLSEVDGFSAPFEECEEMRGLRAGARRMADSDLPLMLTGNGGVGRRTLAFAVARVRAGGKSTSIRVLEASNESTMDELRRATARPLAIVMMDVDCLQPAEQAQLCEMMKRAGTRWIGTATSTVRLVPELLARTSSSTWNLPDLCRRDADSLHWAKHFLAQATQASSEKRRFATDAERVIRTHPWPGNLIQLRATVERAFVAAEGAEIRADDLSIARGTSAAAPSAERFPTLAEATRAFQREHVERALALSGGNRTRAAKLLGVDVRTVFRLLSQ